MARAALNWSTQDLAREADVGANTVNRFEAGQDARMSSVDKMRAAFQSAGVIFVEENGEGPGVRMRKAPRRPDHPEPVGPATEVVKQMDAAIDTDRRKPKPDTIPLEDLNASNDE